MSLSGDGLLDQGEFWVLLFVLGVVMLNWPILAIAAGAGNVLGLPFILVYIAAVWSAVIACIYLFDRRDKD